MATNEVMQKIASLGLYDSINYDDNVKDVISDYLCGRDYNNLAIDIYCPFCRKLTTINPSNENQLNNFGITNYAAFVDGKLNFLVLHFRCARDFNHYFCIQLIYIEKQLYKIGQFPSRATIDAPELNRFKKILPEEKLSDLKRAIGLFSHGVGAGSFIYLRRVYEYLIFEAKEEAKNDSSFNIELFDKSIMIEKIELLKNYLPSFLINNKSAYGILSKGVHELSEKECLNSFNLLEKTIELILQEKLEKKEKKDMEDEITKDLSMLGSILSNNN